MNEPNGIAIIRIIPYVTVRTPEGSLLNVVGGMYGVVCVINGSIYSGSLW